IGSVTVNGRPAGWKNLDDSVGVPRIQVWAPADTQFDVVVDWKGAAPAITEKPKKAEFSGSTHVPEGVNVSLWDAVDEPRKQGVLSWRDGLDTDLAPDYEIVASEHQDA